MTEKENVFYYQGSRYSAERMNRLIISLQKVESEINREYKRLVEERRKNGDEIIPPFRDMEEKKVVVELDQEMLDYIDSLNYIKHIYEHGFKGKVVTLKVGIEEREEGI